MVLAMLLLLPGLLLDQGGNYPSFPCFKHHGRFTTQNGIAQVIWLIGTKRRLAVDGELPKALADLEDPYMLMTGDQHSYIYGDFTICPLSPDVPGHMRLVKVTAAEKLVVENIEGLRPPFKVLSTWPKQ
jgi:hypothetical protein